MKPVAIIQHESGVSAGHFSTWLHARSLSGEIIGVYRDDALPRSSSRFAGICSLGGSMSVNDPLPWIGDELKLMRDAIEQGVPIIGHCLGGQLLAKALGAQVTRSKDKEIGWLGLQAADAALATDWFGQPSLDEIFQWHSDVFELPHGAQRLLTSPLASNQAFVVERRGTEHLAMQFHIEMTPELVSAWASDPAAELEIAAEITATGGPGVQSTSELRRDLERRTARMETIAWRLYDRWARGLRR